MDEEITQGMPDGRSFEERVFARFDALDARLQKLEGEAERRALETRPIWERALAEIVEVRQGLDQFRGEVNDALRDLSRKIGVLGSDMIQLRGDQAHAEGRLDKLESIPPPVNTPHFTWPSASHDGKRDFKSRAMSR